jgi:T5orf172 domain
MERYGFIYAICATGTPYIKIGKTHHGVKMRLDSLQTGNHCRLTILSTWKLPLHLLAPIEKQMHALLIAHHHQSEWFALPGWTAEDFSLLMQQALHNSEAGIATQGLPRQTYTPRGSRWSERGILLLPVIGKSSPVGAGSE